MCKRYQCAGLWTGQLQRPGWPDSAFRCSQGTDGIWIYDLPRKRESLYDHSAERPAGSGDPAFWWIVRGGAGAGAGLCGPGVDSGWGAPVLLHAYKRRWRRDWRTDLCRDFHVGRGYPDQSHDDFVLCGRRGAYFRGNHDCGRLYQADSHQASWPSDRVGGDPGAGQSGAEYGPGYNGWYSFGWWNRCSGPELWQDHQPPEKLYRGDIQYPGVRGFGRPDSPDHPGVCWGFRGYPHFSE